jgi:hypothetical protein
MRKGRLHRLQEACRLERLHTIHRALTAANPDGRQRSVRDDDVTLRPSLCTDCALSQGVHHVGHDRGERGHLLLQGLPRINALGGAGAGVYRDDDVRVA